MDHSVKDLKPREIPEPPKVSTNTEELAKTIEEFSSLRDRDFLSIRGGALIYQRSPVRTLAAEPAGAFRKIAPKIFQAPARLLTLAAEARELAEALDSLRSFYLDLADAYRELESDYNELGHVRAELGRERKTTGGLRAMNNELDATVRQQKIELDEANRELEVLRELDRVHRAGK